MGYVDQLPVCRRHALMQPLSWSYSPHYIPSRHQYGARQPPPPSKAKQPSLWPCIEASSPLAPLKAEPPSPSAIHLVCQADSEDESCSTWHRLMRHRSVLDCCGTSEPVARALFATMCSSSNPDEAQAACEELSTYWTSIKQGGSMALTSISILV